ncbi:MAG TPA: hypothetical protein VKD72_05175 [Gemmataceae bacterium]|nr:hypothetical protein [Gemmataceae bacterium]
MKGHASTPLSVVFSPDGKLLASGSSDHTVKVWDAATGQEVATFKEPTNAVACVAFSPDGKRLASASRDGVVRIWDVSAVRPRP